MRVGVIQASSQIEKNQLLFDTTVKYAKEVEVVNFGCFQGEPSFSFVEISILAGLLLESKAVDFIVTGCSSGQGMMLALNSFPGVLCGYAYSPKDAYLFAQINNGNAISLPLGEDYTYSGKENLEKTLEALFSEPFGQGYPKPEAERKKKDTLLLKDIRRKSQVNSVKFLNTLDEEIVEKVLGKKNVTDYILENGSNQAILKWIGEKLESTPVDELLNNVDKIHTTKLGAERIKNNLKLSDVDVIDYCISMVKNPSSDICKKGKNWYVSLNNEEVTINSYNYSIITAHVTI